MQCSTGTTRHDRRSRHDQVDRQGRHVPTRFQPFRPVGKSIDVEQLTCQPVVDVGVVTIVPKMRAGRPPDQVEVGSKSSQPIQPAKPAQPAAASFVGADRGRGLTRRMAKRAARTHAVHRRGSQGGSNGHKDTKGTDYYFAASHPEVVGDGSKIIHQTRQTAFDATPG